MRACQNCALRSSLEYTDIRLGDFWGKCYDTDTKGVSGVTLVTENGKRIFDLIQDEVITKEHGFSDFMPYQSWNINYHVDEELRNHLFYMLKNSSLKDILNYYYTHQSLSQTIKRYLKNVVFLLSPELINKIKKIYHQIHAF